jgi:hypothetical protein
MAECLQALPPAVVNVAENMSEEAAAVSTVSHMMRRLLRQPLPELRMDESSRAALAVALPES